MIVAHLGSYCTLVVNQFLLTLNVPVWWSGAALHAGPTAAPIPGWVVLIGGVLGLWAVIGGSVVVADRLLKRVWSDQ